MEEQSWQYLSEDNYEIGSVLIPVYVECLCGHILKGWELDSTSILPCICGRTYRLAMTMEVKEIEED